MRAIVYDGVRAVRLENVREPAIVASTDALVRVTLSGICGTDLHLISGHFSGLQPGTIMGHEFVGDVVDVGSAVQRIKRGDHVMASDFTACGHCRWCARGDHWECDDRAFFGSGRAFGPDLAGAQAELVRVPLADTTLLPVPSGCSDEGALLIGDNLATAWAAIERGEVRAGDNVAIIGGGTIGQLASLSAQAAGAGLVAVIEPNERRRSFAELHGALAVAPDRAAEFVRRLTGGDGADIAIEAVGGDSPLAGAMSVIRKRGRVVSVGAHHAQTWPLAISRCFSDEITLTFAIGDSIRLRHRLARLVASRVLDPTIVVGARIPLASAPSAYEDLAHQKLLKAVIDPRL